MKEKELKIARDNVSTLMQGKFIFNPERFLNKKVNEEQITDRILKNIRDNNDDIYLIHEPSTNSFSLRCKDGM